MGYITHMTTAQMIQNEVIANRKLNCFMVDSVRGGRGGRVHSAERVTAQMAKFYYDDCRLEAKIYKTDFGYPEIFTEVTSHITTGLEKPVKLTRETKTYKVFDEID